MKAEDGWTCDSEGRWSFDEEAALANHKCGRNDVTEAVHASIDEFTHVKSFPVLLTWCVVCGEKQKVEMA